MPQSASSPLGWLGRLNGPQTLGNSRFFWVGFLVVLALLVCLPFYASRFQTINASNIAISSILAMSLCLIWGYGGILSLGQAAFFGIGGYAYGIVGMNLIRAHGNTDLAILAGMAAPALFAAVLGALMFYSRLKGVYVAILTLVVSLLLGLFMRQTADPSYAIGTAALGGMNGLKAAGSGNPGIPNLTLGLGELVAEFDGRRPGFYWLVLGIGTAVYLGLRLLVNSKHGYILLSCREDLERTETFGYDVRRVQLTVFALSAAIAGLAGTLYTAWGTYIHPDGFSVAPNILVVIWVAVGGRKDLTSVVLGTIFLSWTSLQLASYGEISLFALGLILVVAMMVAPEGIIATLGAWIGRMVARLSGRKPADPDLAPVAVRGRAS
jgi:ABC-type branched-subunit amino acid transport system permease subunit